MNLTSIICSACHKKLWPAAIYLLFDFLSRLEKGQLVRCDICSVPRISSVFVLPHREVPKSPDFNSAAILECPGKTVEDQVYNVCRVLFFEFFFPG